MKKKVLSVALVVALIAIMVSGTLAYFTATDEVTNTFTIGSVDIEILEDFQEPDTMIPVVTPDESDPNYINKDARVKNTGENAAYVQMYVAIPKVMYLLPSCNLNSQELSNRGPLPHSSNTFPP